jgi:lipoprotein-releasing system permease protein
MPLGEAQKFFNLPGAAHVVEILIDNPDDVDEMRPLVTAAAGEEMYITDWRQRNATFYNTLQVERNVMFLILMLIVLVAGLNIISGMIMLVKDKGRDIGILRTMGASRGAIMRVFFITGASIGVIGTMAGLILGIVVCLNIEEIRQFISWMTSTQLFPSEVYFLSRLPAEMDSGEITTIVIMALAISVVATLYPSWRAARLDPVEALRYE